MCMGVNKNNENNITGINGSRVVYEHCAYGGVPWSSVPMVHRRGLGIRRTDYIMVNTGYRHHRNINCIGKE